MICSWPIWIFPERHLEGGHSCCTGGGATATIMAAAKGNLKGGLKRRKESKINCHCSLIIELSLRVSRTLMLGLMREH